MSGRLETGAVSSRNVMLMRGKRCETSVELTTSENTERRCGVFRCFRVSVYTVCVAVKEFVKEEIHFLFLFG